jgi:hypothetical protein
MFKFIKKRKASSSESLDDASVNELTSEGVLESSEQADTTDASDITMGSEIAEDTEEGRVQEEEFVDTDESEDEDVESLPKILIIGHYSNIKKKDLVKYLFNRASTNMDISNAYYDIQKFDDGFIWSLQEGGADLGCLTSLKSLLDNGETNIVINVDNRQLQIIRKPYQSGFSSFLINAEEKLDPSEGIAFTDKIKPVVKQGLALLWFSIGLFAVSIVFLFLSALFKFVIYNTEQQASVSETEIEMPHTVGNKLIVQSDEYISEIKFSNGRWNNPVRTKEQVAAPTKESDVVNEAADLLKQEVPNE